MVELTVTGLILLTIFSEAFGQGWQEPYFRDPGTDGVDYLVGGSTQRIEMQEELQLPIKLAVLSYTGPGTPTIGNFAFGSSQYLHLSLSKIGNEWTINITNRQDYENPSQYRNEFSVIIPNDSAVTVEPKITLLLSNIFDNAPTIIYNGPCIAEELRSNYSTECKFEVYDADGMGNNDIRLQIEGNNNESEKFGFRFDRNDTYTMEFTLFVINELRYEERAVYNFKTFVFDVANNTGSVTTIVEINDRPSLDPKWVKPFATARFEEKSYQNFTVRAIDGDTGLNFPIYYKLEFHLNEDYGEYISIDSISGNITILPINRDALKQEVFPFNVIAYKAGNESWAINGEAVLIVDDINDNFPEIEIVQSEIFISENKYLTLELERFIVNDIDLGIHATYDVSLLSESGSTYSDSFTIIPTKGYQETSFTISVTNTTKLDYEDPEWQQFQIIIKSQEEADRNHYREFALTINLINWNDEIPIFNQSEFYIEVYENVTANQILTTITATDRDVDDHVIHTIFGMSDLLITEDGVISTQIANQFDFERQRQVLVQIQATDTLQTFDEEKLNSAFAQLIINVQDINDETPQIRMPQQSPEIFENTEEGTLVTDGIIATDPDTSADLEFRINWNLSYATKSGQHAKSESYENCFIIEPNKADPNRVIGHLRVNPEFPWKIDYEEYEVIYLTVMVTDLNQEEGEGTAEAVLTIRIKDENDCKPAFILDTLNTPRSVVEEVVGGTLIGTIFAIDNDGPEFNIITYSIRPSEGTPDDLVEINAVNGAITVKESAIIDCDEPKIDDLVYEISLNDGFWTETGEIRIRIIDINNKVPGFDIFETTIRMYENATTGDDIQKILTFDLDRDDPHNKVQYMINFVQFQNLGRYFYIDEESGQLSVKLLGEAVLDRDQEHEDTHDIHIIIQDNFHGNGRTNKNELMVKLILLDVNDNAPEMPQFRPTILENAQIGSKIGDRFYAPDIDDPNTPNAKVHYRIISVEPGRNHSDIPPNPNDIFDIYNYEDMYCDIIVKQSLKGYYGTWLVTIEAYDHGHEGDSQIQLASQETYEITIDPVNYNAPEIIYPFSGKTHRLSYDNQLLNRPLILADNTPVPMFEARDDDGGIYGDIKFELSNYGAGDDMTYFYVVKENRTHSHIFLSKEIEARFYQLNVRAVDGGSNASTWATGILFIFIDLTGEPVFDMPTFDTDFTENTTGLVEYRTIPEAIDPKNIGIENENDKFAIYYFIDNLYRPDDASLFELDSITRRLKLASQLDREVIDSHQIRIMATNNRDGPQSTKESSSSMLIVNISVNDVNDNPPSFELRSYGGGITPTDWMGKEILTVIANDPDLDDRIRYVFDVQGITSNGDNLQDVTSTAFNLSSSTGLLSLNFEVLSTMKGFFEFKIVAYDKVDHSDTCDVKIFIIADSARVTFVLLNEKSSVDLHRSYVAKTLTEHYGYECNIDDVQKAVINGVAQETITNVRAHFIQNNEAIEASVILTKSSDIVFITNLKSALLQESINLLDVPNDIVEAVSNWEYILRVILITISVILATLSCSLIVTYCIKTRSLNRQLKALSATDFGSTESNLNRREAPTTNVFSVEGSNPVLNSNDLDRGMFDNMSVNSESSSDDSEFVGIDKDPTFAPNFKRESTNVAVLNGINGRMGHVHDIKEDFDNYMNESKKSSKNSDFGFSKF